MREIELILKEAYSRVTESATCVQKFDDSLNSAIRITYRISLRSSSLREPRYPLLRVVHVYEIKRVVESESNQKKLPLLHTSQCIDQTITDKMVKGYDKKSEGFKERKGCVVTHN